MTSPDVESQFWRDVRIIPPGWRRFDFVECEPLRLS